MFFANFFDSLFNFVASAYIFSFPFYLSYYLLSLGMQELSGHKRIIRVMPNTPSAVGEAASGELVWFSFDFSHLINFSFLLCSLSC